MSLYNFDEIIDRKGTDSLKWDCLEERFGRKDLQSFWVADMDFRTPDFIVDAVSRRAAHPVYGYTRPPYDYFNTIAAWVRQLHGWDVGPSHIRFIPGIVKGIAYMEHLLLKPGEKVIIQSPVYHPFRLNTRQLGFEVVENPLLPRYDANGFLSGYEMNFEELEQLCRQPDVKMLLLANPHNPAGISWSRETLERLAHICFDNGVTVVSDEIHSEMVLHGRRHLPFASVCPEAAQNSITFMAPSKTFNIAGVVSSYCIIENEALRERVFNWLDATETSFASIFSIAATMAAYTQGAQWRQEMLDYVQGNIDFTDSWLRRELPQIHALKPDASFLVWLDCRQLGLSHEQLIDLFVNRARLALNDGAMFGQEGKGFMRLNVGCPRILLQEALESLKKAYESIV